MMPAPWSEQVLAHRLLRPIDIQAARLVARIDREQCQELPLLAALTSWWLLFALFALPPLMMMVGGAAMMATGGSFARFCAQMPCGSWLRNDIARATPLR